MLNFEFTNPTRIFFGTDQLANIDKQVPAGATVVITYGGGSAKRSGLIDKVKAALGERKVYEFGGIEPNPRFETLVKAAQLVRSTQADFIIAVGGGSVIDGTKFISLAASYDGDPNDLLKFGLGFIPHSVVGKIVPFGSVLTLPATGSEMNPTAVVSYGDGKFPVKSTLAYPVFSVLDPTVTYTLPQVQVANGVVDAFVHVVEQYLTYPVDGRLQDRFAEGILQTLIEIGQTAVACPDDYNARANLVWSATLALNGLIGSGVPQDWATHMIGHELTASFGIDHAQTLAIVLPVLLEEKREQKRAKLLQYAERVWHIQSGGEDEKIILAIQKTRAFFESLGVKTCLSQYGVKPDQLPAIAEQLRAHNMVKLGEHEDITPDVSLRILQRAM